MKISNFTSDQKQMEAWLEEMVSTFSNDDQTASYWFHSENNGFGIVLMNFVNDTSGEFHLFGDGRISESIEKNIDIIGGDWHRASHFHEFEDRFKSFSQSISGAFS